MNGNIRKELFFSNLHFIFRIPKGYIFDYQLYRRLLVTNYWRGMIAVIESSELYWYLDGCYAFFYTMEWNYGGKGG